MKKSTTLILLALGCTDAALAQDTRLEHMMPGYKSAPVFGMMPETPPPAARKTTGPKQRVILCIGEIMNPYQMFDSTRYQYSGLRGSHFNLSSLTYVDGYNSGFQPNGSNVAEVQFDTARYYSALASGNPVVPYRLQTSSYTSTGNIAGMTARFFTTVAGPGSLERFTYTFDATGRPETNTIEAYDTVAGAYVPTYRHYYGYSIGGHRILDSMTKNMPGGWEGYSKYQLAYNTAGKVTSMLYERWDSTASMFDTVSITELTYYPDNKSREELHWTATSGAGLMLSYRDSLEYDAGNDVHRRHTQYYYLNGVLNGVHRSTRHFNALGLPDSTVADYQNPATGVWQVVTRTAIEYNSYNNPTQQFFLTPNGIHSGTTTYYYEEYNDATAVPQIVKKADMRLFPNPVGTMLNIEWKGAVQGAPVHIMISNVAGQKIMSLQQRWAGTQQQFNIDALKPGLYLVTVQDAAGNAVFSNKIVKQ